MEGLEIFEKHVNTHLAKYASFALSKISFVAETRNSNACVWNTAEEKAAFHSYGVLPDIFKLITVHAPNSSPLFPRINKC